ncbi:MAG: primosomal protein N' [Firmicutes bacterium]|nr:primosomal protein N' [Bacillota bacterium]
MGNIASVVISNCTREFDKEYHYVIPAKLKDSVKPGVRVIVPFGKTNMPKEAYVLDVLDSSNWDGLKSINKLVDEKPVLNERMIRLAAWMRERYICTYHDAIKCMLPAGVGVKAYRIVKLENYEGHVKENEKKILDALVECGNECELTELKNKLSLRSFHKYLRDLEAKGIISIREEFATRVKEKFIRVAYAVLPKEEIANVIEGNKLKRIQQIKVLEILMDNEYVAVQDIVKFAGVSPGVLDTLKKYGYIDFKEIEVKRSPFKDTGYESTRPLDLTDEQDEALKILKDRIDEGRFSEFLLHGVTGSGKTEVYMQLIQYVIGKGKEAIVLVPEISLTPQMTARFKGRFGNDVAVLHSRLSLGERYDQWRLIMEKKIKVVIGARSAIFAPLERIGLIIIDEEHEGSYKSEITPKYHAADIARYICKQQGGLLLLGSATPSVETYYRAEEGKIGFIEMKERPNNMLLPRVELVDMREELNKGNRSIFSNKLAEEISKNIDLRQQTILLLNRRGYSPFVLCRNCGYVARCINCSITLTYHAIGERLTCHYCGYTVKVPKECPKCKSKYIRHFGLGTQKLEEETKRYFPGSTVIRMDSDTTGYKNSHADILGKFRDQNINIMVGTQMIAKGHDFPNVTLVGVLAADSMLNIADYRASEKTFQLLTQVAGRAGRGEIPGRVVIQSYNTEDFSILAACKHDYASFYRQEIRLRKEMDYPPFTNIALVIMSGVSDKTVLESSKIVKNIICRNFESKSIDKNRYEILGPMKPPIVKIKNKYRWRLVLKSKDIDILINVLRETSDEFNRVKNNKDMIELSIDINPVNML